MGLEDCANSCDDTEVVSRDAIFAEIAKRKKIIEREEKIIEEQERVKKDYRVAIDGNCNVCNTDRMFLFVIKDGKPLYSCSKCGNIDYYLVEKGRL